MKDMNGQPRHFRVSMGTIITAALLLLITAALFFLIRTGFFTSDNPDDGSYDETSDPLSGLEETGETDVIYAELRELEPQELLDSLRDADSVVWNYRTVDAWETDYTVTRTTASKLGEKYRIEDENRLIICDGKTVYRKEGMLEMTLDARLTDFYTEAGLTPLWDLQGLPAQNVSASYDDPKNIKYIRMTVQDGDWRSEYKISVETGFPVEERSYLGSIVYRMVLTDSISVFAAKELPASYFEIPDPDS